MALTSALSAASAGLRVTSLRAGLVATNVANASTPGYVRRSLSVSESILGGSTVGVISNGIVRSEDAFLTSTRLSLTSDLAQADVLAASSQSLSAQVGDGLGNEGLFGAYQRLETALAAAADSPDSAAQTRSLFQAAEGLVNEFNTLSINVETQRAEADREIAASVDIINTTLQEISDLNNRIISAPEGSASRVPLLDDRQRALDTLSEYLPIQTIPRDRGRIDVLTTEGVFLVSGTARELAFNTSSNYATGQTVDNGGLSGLTVDGINITPGSDSFGAVSSGIIGGLFQVRDQVLPTFSSQLDTLAEDLVSRFSNDAIDPTKTPGDPGIFVLNAAPADRGSAGRLELNALLDPDQGGDTFRFRDGLGALVEGDPGNRTILDNLFTAFTEVRSINTNGFSGALSSTELSGQFAARVGQNRVTQDTVLTSINSQFETVRDAETNETGVDVDQQLQDLLLIEQAFSANARVIQVIDDLLSELLRI